MNDAKPAIGPICRTAIVGTVVLMLGIAANASSGPATHSLPPLYPDVGAGTRILDHDKLLRSVTLNDPGFYTSAVDWYEANIPFLDIPDKTIQDIYYYRWSAVKRSLKNTGAAGYISSARTAGCATSVT